MKNIFRLTAGLSLAVVMMTSNAFAGTFAVAELGDNVDMHTPLQTEALADYTEIRDYVQGKEELSAPQGVTISWEYSDPAEEYVVSLSVNPDMSDAVQITCTETECNVKNLYLGQTYYYTISAGDDTSDVCSFTTGMIPPRNLAIDPVPNVRDIGGWEIQGGGHVKQGMLFRTAGLYTEDERYPSITEEGIELMKSVIAPKTEIDVRGAEENWGQTACPVGEDVAYIHIPMESPFKATYGDTTFHEAIKEVLKVMTDENNYPIIYHCAVGTDRTGFLTTLVLGLLGVAEEDILRDYVFSSFAGIGTMRDDSNMKSTIMNALEPYGGATLQENVRSYMQEIGLTEEEMDSIVAIMTAE